jgi:hypothetical protein
MGVTAPEGYTTVGPWMPVPGTRTEGDEVLIARSDEGVIVRDTLSSPGVFLSFRDLHLVMGYALRSPDADRAGGLSAIACS